MESLGTGARGETDPFFAGGASLLEERGLTGGTACWRNGAGALIINFLLILLWIEMKL